MKKIIFFSLFIFLLFSSQTSAFEDSCERYPSGAYTDYWDYTLTGAGTSWSGSAELAPYVEIPTTAIKITAMGSGSSLSSTWGVGYSSIMLNESVSPEYFSFIFLDGYDGLYSQYSYSINANLAGLYIQVYEDDGATQLASYQTLTTTDNVKYEVIKSGSYFDIYANGVLISSLVNSAPGYSGDVKYKVMVAAVGARNTPITRSIYVDDFSTGSIIGIPEVINDGSTNLVFTWSSQLMRNYETQHEISLYSLTAGNAGLISNWDIPESDNSSSSEYGYFTMNRNTLLGENFGLYLLEITRGSLVVYDQYFYHDQLADPIGYPELLFSGGADVEADIRDQNYNGGIISSGGSVYLYPTVTEDGIYNFSYNILEISSSFDASLTKMYNNTPLNETNINFTGLAGQNYYISLNGEDIGGTNSSNTWNTSLSWDSVNTNILSFNPDYTLPGAWGYVKNSETQNPLKSATVTISNGSKTFYLYTDSNGQYYKTVDMGVGSYNISAAKSGYTSSVPYTVTTQNGSTTRQDLFLDPVSGSGVYYAAHDVTFTVLEYWYSSVGLPEVTYTVYDDENETVKTGLTGTKGTFSVKDMNQGIKYTIVLTYNGTTYTEYIEPGLTEYNLVLNKEGIIHEYYNNWLTLTYAETTNNVTVLYDSNKTITEASLTVTASNGTIVQSDTLNTTSGTFVFNFTDGDYILQFDIEASDGSTASQAWSISSPPEVTLFPASYPTWLKNTLFVAIIIIFLLAFGKSKNDIACGAVAVLTSLGYYFEWLTCSFNFVVLIWIIAIGAIYLHYKRTGAVG